MLEQRPKGDIYQRRFPETVQKYHLVWGVRQFSCMIESSTISSGQTVSRGSFSLLLLNGAIKMHSAVRHTEVPEVCTAFEEALDYPFACVPL